jgi:hypothetical protein
MAFRCAILFAVLVAVLPNALGYSAGAPEGACEDMVPQHHTDPQSSPAPYSIQLSKSRIRAGDAVQVTIRGKYFYSPNVEIGNLLIFFSFFQIGNSNNDLIKGFLVQARVGNTPVGKFEIEPNNGLIQKMNCGNGNGVSNFS